MHYKKIEINNFGTISHAVLNLEHQGMVLITGVNKDTPKADSNGSGKSLLLDAFCWALWGSTLREYEADEVVHRLVGKDCSVSVHCSDDINEYVVTRYRKHTTSKKPNDVEVYQNGKDISAGITKTTQAIITNMIGMSFEVFCALMPGAGVPVASMTDGAIKSLLENMLQITDLAKAKKVTDSRIKENTGELKESQGSLVSLSSERALLQNQLVEYNQALSLFEHTRTQAVAVLDQDIQRLVTSNQQINQKLAVAQVKAALAGVAYQTEQELGKQLRQVVAKIDQTKGKLLLLNEQIASLEGLGDVCDVCKQDVPDTHVATCKNSVEADRQGLFQELNPLVTTRVELNQAVIEAQEAYAAAQAAVQEAKGYLALILSQEDRIRAFRSTREAKLSEVPTYVGWIASHEASITDLNERVEQAQRTVQVRTEDGVYLDFWRQAFSTQGIRNFLLDNVTPVLNASAEKYCNDLTDGEMRVTFCTKVQLKDGQTSEKFRINVEQKHGGGSYASNSTGEKERANLVVALCLSDLAVMHSRHNVDFRFYDEAFSGIDASGATAVLSLLTEQRNKYPTVFVVTHEDRFKEAFTKELRMTKENDMSTLSEVM